MWPLDALRRRDARALARGPCPDDRADADRVVALDAWATGGAGA